ncbi:hypothetical protein DFH06DRAFT_69891 [Mycena polygramma]|nr:hypothetical protein DFH06DRAFT_69891 [Mycena polygramma]
MLLRRPRRSAGLRTAKRNPRMPASGALSPSSSAPTTLPPKTLVWMTSSPPPPLTTRHSARHACRHRLRRRGRKHGLPRLLKTLLLLRIPFSHAIFIPILTRIFHLRVSSLHPPLFNLPVYTLSLTITHRRRRRRPKR